jgi:hypothetical protein
MPRPSEDEERSNELRVTLTADERRVRKYREQARRAVSMQERERLEGKAQYYQDHATGLRGVIGAWDASQRPVAKSVLPTANQLYRDIMAAMRGWPE